MKIDLKSYSPKTEKIEIPEWTSEPIFVRELLGAQLELLQRHTHMEDGVAIIDHQNALLVICSVVDSDGHYLFTEKDISDIEKQPATVIASILTAVGKVSNLKV